MRTSRCGYCLSRPPPSFHRADVQLPSRSSTIIRPSASTAPPLTADMHEHSSRISRAFVPALSSISCAPFSLTSTFTR